MRLSLEGTTRGGTKERREGGREAENREKEQVGRRGTKPLLFAGLVETRGPCWGGGVFPPH